MPSLISLHPNPVRNRFHACRQGFRLRWFPCLLSEFDRNMSVCNSQQGYSPRSRRRGRARSSRVQYLRASVVQSSVFPIPRFALPDRDRSSGRSKPRIPEEDRRWKIRIINRRASSILHLQSSISLPPSAFRTPRSERLLPPGEHGFGVFARRVGLAAEHAGQFGHAILFVQAA